MRDRRSVVPLRVLDGLRYQVAVTDVPSLISSACLAFIKRGEPLLFDTETTGLDPRGNKLVMLQMRQPSSPATLIVDCRTGLWRGARESLQQAFEKLVVVGHNLKFDAEFLLASGLRLSQVFDTMLAEQLLGQSEVNLAATLKRRYGRDFSKLERTWFYQPAPLDERLEEWRSTFPEEEVRYAALDVECLDELFADQRADLTRCKLRRVAHIEMRALPAFAAMEMRGIRVEPEGWRAFIAEQQERAREAADKALAKLGPVILKERIAAYDALLADWQAASAEREAALEQAKAAWGKQPGWGEERKKVLAERPVPSKPKLDTSLPNIGSQQQLITAFRALKIPVPTKKNDKGQVVETTDSDNLEKLVAKYPVVRPILDARRAQKFVDAFGEKLLSFRDSSDRIHPDYHQIGADTGRASCSKPNWQQVPARGEGSRLRKCVIAADGYKLITADFSNIELRIIADLSGDKTMLQMFESGEDLHSFTARTMFDLGPDVDPKHTDWRGGLTYRAAAKIVNYLIPYGGSAFAIAMQNNMPVEDAELLVNKWFGMFPGVKRWMDSLEKAVEGKLESRTLSGRARRYQKPEEPRTRDAIQDYRKQWAAIHRQARNSPVQGLSADITKLAMALFYERCDLRLGCLVAVVHDELVVESPERHSGVVREVLADAMDEAAHAFLKTVALPRPEPTISDCWTHD